MDNSSNNNFNRPVKKWYKKKRWWLVAGLAVFVVVTIIYFRGNKQPEYEFMTVNRGELIQEVSVTGKVRPAHEVDLQFETHTDGYKDYIFIYVTVNGNKVMGVMT